MVSRRHWAGPLCHPVPLGSVLVLALNDHLLKGSGLLPGGVTGKLSDVAGLFFFPLLLSVLLTGASRLARRRVDEGAPPLVPVVSTGAAFAALKLSPAFNALVARAWGPNALDPTDLLCLPVLAASWLWVRHAPVASHCREGLALPKPLEGLGQLRATSSSPGLA
jgi:hypothetical protein